MKNILCKTLVFTICFISSIQLQAATHVSLTSGNWGAASTWNTHTVPTCGDSVIVQGTHIISVTNQQNYSACTPILKIIVYGKIIFYNGSKLSLSCGSYVIVYPGGVIDHDVGLSNSNLINICGNVEWNSNSTLYGLACLPASNPVCAMLLPVELTGFTAQTCKSNKICLNWETASESNNDYYEVERSKDAVLFENVDMVESKALEGNSQYKIDYSYIDVSPLNGINYYRLKQVDKNYNYTYSRIISAQLDLKNDLSFLVFPNYNSGEFTAQVSGLNKSGNIAVLLRDESGNIVYKSLRFIDDTYVQVNVVPEVKLPKGYYFCSFIVYNEEHVVKILVSDL